MTIKVTLYCKNGDNERVTQIRKYLTDFQASIPHELAMVDVSMSHDIGQDDNSQLPTVSIGPYSLKGEFSRQELEIALSAARDRENALNQISGEKSENARSITVTRVDRLSLWLSKYYMWIIILSLLIYVGLPFLAPFLMKEKIVAPARLIYKIYSPLCHQFAFRSWFLFGEQSFYPSDLVQLDGVVSYESWLGQEGIRLSDVSNSTAFIIQAREMLGDERMGYKVALCQRDVAIYGSMLIFGILFAITGRRFKGLSWKWWLIIGILPIALDGGSQLPGLLSWLPISLPLRESTPFLRTFTGILFGVMTAWYLFPVIEESMRETRQMVDWKLAQVAHRESVG